MTHPAKSKLWNINRWREERCQREWVWHYTYQHTACGFGSWSTCLVPGTRHTVSSWTSRAGRSFTCAFLASPPVQCSAFRMCWVQSFLNLNVSQQQLNLRAIILSTNDFTFLCEYLIITETVSNAIWQIVLQLFMMFSYQVTITSFEFLWYCVQLSKGF